MKTVFSKDGTETTGRSGANEIKDLQKEGIPRRVREALIYSKIEMPDLWAGILYSRSQASADLMSVNTFNLHGRSRQIFAYATANLRCK